VLAGRDYGKEVASMKIKRTDKPVIPTVSVTKMS
jgi:hypothetical protein